MSAPPFPPASTLRRPPRFPTAAAAILCVTGLVLFGQGVWIHAKALLAQVLLERAFAASLADGQPVKPWSWADTWPVARIEVPRLHRSEIALAGSSGQALAVRKVDGDSGLVAATEPILNPRTGKHGPLQAPFRTPARSIAAPRPAAQARS